MDASPWRPSIQDLFEDYCECDDTHTHTHAHTHKLRTHTHTHTHTHKLHAQAADLRRHNRSCTHAPTLTKAHKRRTYSIQRETNVCGPVSFPSHGAGQLMAVTHEHMHVHSTRANTQATSYGTAAAPNTTHMLVTLCPFSPAHGAGLLIACVCRTRHTGWHDPCVALCPSLTTMQGS